MTFEPADGYIAVRLHTIEQTPGGIFLPQTINNNGAVIGEIVNISDITDYCVGQTVGFIKYEATPIEFDGDTLYFIDEGKVLFRIRDYEQSTTSAPCEAVEA